jgi:hypothetical protein
MIYIKPITMLPCSLVMFSFMMKSISSTYNNTKFAVQEALTKGGRVKGAGEKNTQVVSFSPPRVIVTYCFAFAFLT